MTPDPKPERRRVATAEEWAELHRQLRAIFNGRCQVSGQSELLTAHHLVPRSLGGDDVIENLALVNGSGTTGVHGAIEARDPETLIRLRHSLSVAQIAYIIEKKGQDWLERYYPTGWKTEAASLEGYPPAIDLQTTIEGDEVPHEHVVGQNGVVKECPRCHGKGKIEEKPKDEGEREPRPKVIWNLRAPKDVGEDGPALLDEREAMILDILMKAGMLQSAKGARYYVVLWTFDFVLRNIRAFVDELEGVGG